MLGPAAFMPLADSHHFVRTFADTTLDLVFKDIAGWDETGKKLDIAVNMSAAALVEVSLPEKLESRCKACGISNDVISIEMTESMLDRNLVDSLEVLTRLRMRALGLSLDDFGTGYSSLERLKRIPFDELKIDGSFVRGANTDPAAKAIFESSVSLGRQLNMTIVAEGVETREDWIRSRELGCDVVQGFFVAHPMSAADFQTWLRNWRGFDSPNL